MSSLEAVDLEGDGILAAGGSLFGSARPPEGNYASRTEGEAR